MATRGLEGSKQWNDIKTCNSLIPSERQKLNKSKRQTPNHPLKNKKQVSLYKALCRILFCLSKQITDKCWTKLRYNLQFIKCTSCIVQDKVVKVVKLSGPVRLWDSGSWVGGVVCLGMFLSPPALTTHTHTHTHTHRHTHAHTHTRVHSQTHVILCGPHITCKTEHKDTIVILDQNQSYTV